MGGLCYQGYVYAEVRMKLEEKVAKWDVQGTTDRKRTLGRRKQDEEEREMNQRPGQRHPNASELILLMR